VEAQSSHDRAAEVLVLEPTAAGPTERAHHRGAQQRDEREVIEVPRLERGVLPVVGEGQELARNTLGRHIAVVHPPQDAGDQDRRGGAPSLHREPGKAVRIPALWVMRLTASETEPEL